jgi:hypothetical protein
MSYWISLTIAGSYGGEAHSDPLVQVQLLLVILLRVEGVEADLVVHELSLDLRVSACRPEKDRQIGAHPLLEEMPLLQCQSIRLGDDGNDVDDFGKLFQDNDIDLQREFEFPPTCQGIFQLTGFNVCPVGLMKKRQQWILVSGM